MGIFSEHCIEHVPLSVGDALLGECFRVLRPGGTVRLVTPDAERYLVGYADLHADPDGESLPKAQNDRYHGVYTPVMSVNRVFGQFGHRFIYDFETFEVLLRGHGFVDIERRELRERSRPTPAARHRATRARARSTSRRRKPPAARTT